MTTHEGKPEGSAADRFAEQRELENQDASVARGRDLFDSIHPSRGNDR